jgi:hypothetical protein
LEVGLLHKQRPHLLELLDKVMLLPAVVLLSVVVVAVVLLVVVVVVVSLLLAIGACKLMHLLYPRPQGIFMIYGESVLMACSITSQLANYQGTNEVER